MNAMNEVKASYLRELSGLIYLTNPRKIKLSPNLFMFLKDEFTLERNFFNGIEVIMSAWQGVPIEIDYNKNGYDYEGIYD